MNIWQRNLIASGFVVQNDVRFFEGSSHDRLPRVGRVLPQFTARVRSRSSDLFRASRHAPGPRASSSFSVSVVSRVVAMASAPAGPLGAVVDGLLATALDRVFGPGPNTVALGVFFHHALLALLMCLGVFLASRALSPALFGRAMSTLDANDRKIWHTNMVTFFPTFAVTYFAAPAILEYAGPRHEFAHPASANTLKGTGMSLGYMFWDLCVLLADPRGQMRAYGGVSPYVLFLFHHALSLAAWPYAVSAGKCVYFVNYFLVSEVTNFNMSLRWFLLKTGREKSRTYFWNGMAWIPLFLAVRIAVIPNLVDQYWNSDWSALGPIETWAARVLLPVPVGLNVYWFGLIAVAAVNVIRTGSEDGAPAESAETERKKRR